MKYISIARTLILIACGLSILFAFDVIPITKISAVTWVVSFIGSLFMFVMSLYEREWRKIE